MNSHKLTRRRALGALAVSPVALALPAAAAPSMTQQERLEHHFEGLAKAMAEMTFGKWEVRVVSGDPDQGLVLRQLVDREDDGPLLADDVTGTSAFADWERRRKRV